MERIMREAFDSAVALFDDHPLIALSLLIFVAIPLLLGWMHEGRFFGECFIVGIHFFKHEVSAWAEFLRRLKRELTTWKSDP
jgi:hypothetical protein